MAPPPAAASAASDDEDDYMNMAIEEPTAKETSFQRRARQKREAAQRGLVKSKAEQAAEAEAMREAALAKSMLSDPAKSSSKGLAMMAKMGFKPGQALGKKDPKGESNAISEPIAVNIKEDRGGIGLDSERKRKLQEATEHEVKRAKAEEGEYRERVRLEREATRLEAMVGNAMRIAEKMTSDKEEEQAGAVVTEADRARQPTISKKPLKSINLLWRGLVRGREEKERDRRMRYDLQQSLSRLPTYTDPDEDNDDKMAMGKNNIEHAMVEDLDEEDPELDEFNALEAAERLKKLVEYLRSEFNYCFWCKYTYPDKEMDGCPGITEEDHD